MKLIELYMLNPCWRSKTILEVSMIFEHGICDMCKGELNDIITTYYNYEVHCFADNFVCLIYDNTNQ